MAAIFALALSDAEVEAQIRDAPPVVRAFIERRAGCNHWGGEYPYDAERAREIKRVGRELHCRRLDADEHRLRKAFAHKAKILKLISITSDRDF